MSDQLLIVGDFNIHVDDTDKAVVRKFIEHITAVNLQQHVSGPTHRCGHTLDLVLSRKNEDIVQEVYVSQDMISDHATIMCDIILRPDILTRSVKHIRKLKSLDMDKFADSLTCLVTSAAGCEKDVSVDTLAALYQNGIKNILDEVVPVQTVITKALVQ